MEHFSTKVYISDQKSEQNPPDIEKVDFGISIWSVELEGAERHFAFVSKPEDESLAAKFDIKDFDEILMVNSSILFGKSQQEVLDRFLKVRVGIEFDLVFRR